MPVRQGRLDGHRPPYWITGIRFTRFPAFLAYILIYVEGLRCAAAAAGRTSSP